MRTQHTDPDMKRYDRQDEIVSCAECHAYMLPLRDYEISRLSEAPAADTEMWEFLVWGWTAFVYNYLYDAFTYENRKRKLAQMKQQILPQFPNSLVCTRCLHLLKRP